jgi:hypothetical protein
MALFVAGESNVCHKYVQIDTIHMDCRPTNAQAENVYNMHVAVQRIYHSSNKTWFNPGDIYAIPLTHSSFSGRVQNVKENSLLKPGFNFHSWHLRL